MAMTGYFKMTKIMFLCQVHFDRSPKSRGRVWVNFVLQYSRFDVLEIEYDCYLKLRRYAISLLFHD